MIPTEIVPDDSSKLKIGTINIWGLYISKKRKSRLEALAKYVRSNDYAILGIQELWVEADFLFLKESFKNILPYSFYYRCGVIGTGLATFSRHPIKDIVYQRFSVNGKVYKLWHGDWWSGKGVGLAKIEVKSGRIINFYNTHLHAEYDDSKAPYLGHRLCQLQELIQFIRYTSEEGRLSVLVGDLNTLPKCFGYEAFFENDLLGAHLIDSGKQFQGSNAQSTFNTTGNSFTKGTEKRLDYIFYLNNGAGSLENYNVLIEDKLAAEGTISISDHCLVSSTFNLHPRPKEVIQVARSGSTVEDRKVMIEKILTVLNTDILNVIREQRLHYVLGVVQLVIFLVIVVGCSIVLTFSTLPTIITLLAFAISPGFLIFALLSLFIGFIWLNEEKSDLTTAKNQWELRLFFEDNIEVSGDKIK